MLLAGVVLGAALSAAEPQPVWDYDFRSGKAAPGQGLVFGGGASLKDGEIVSKTGGSIRTDNAEAFREAMKKTTRRQVGVGLSIRFDKPAQANEKQLDFGFFLLRRTAAGQLEATFLPERDEIRITPLVLTSVEKIEPGKWYDVALNFSAERRRFTMYLNGKWQMDNAIPQVPERIRRTPVNIENFEGAISRFTVYDMAMNSEELTPSGISDEELNALDARCGALKSSGNPALAAWGGELAARLKEISGLRKERKASVARVKRVVNDLKNAEKLAGAAGRDKAFVTYCVDPTSQEMYLPDRLPQDGRIAGNMRLFAAQGENMFASVVVVPLRPVEKFTVRFTPLKTAKGDVIPADRIDAKTVKCWFRCGGAWMNYQADKLTRILTPDLLLYDSSVVRVDENRQSNERLLHLPEGTRYVDNSLTGQDLPEYYMHGKTRNVPFRDADTLQPVKFESAGRNQQYLFTFRIPETQVPGFYSGKLELVADGKVADSLDVVFRVLPFVLPQPKTYYDISRTYFSHINMTWSRNAVEMKKQFEVLRKYNFRYPNTIFDSPDTVRWAKETGMALDEIINTPDLTSNAWLEPWGGDSRRITDEAADKLDSLFLRNWKRKTAERQKLIGDAILYPVFMSENDHYRFTKELPSRPENVYHLHTNVKRFSHSMTEKFILGALDGTDMDASSQIRREWADIWHAAGARVLNYSEPFPGAENPAWFRRKIGLEMYKSNYDGHMMHGFLTGHWNEFTDWPEDPAYKNFGMAYLGDGCIIERLALVGAAEGYNDVSYATKLRQLALPLLASKDVELVKEAKRQLAWLEMLDGKKYDMAAFRQGCAYRILVMLELIDKRKENSK